MPKLLEFLRYDCLSFSFFLFVVAFCCLFSFCLEIYSFFSLSSMRQLCPFVSFLFACLGASLGSFQTHCPPIEGFVFGGNSLGLVLTNLFPLLCQSVNWFEELVGD